VHATFQVFTCRDFAEKRAFASPRLWIATQDVRKLSSERYFSLFPRLLLSRLSPDLERRDRESQHEGERKMTFTCKNIVLATTALLGTTVTLRPASALAFTKEELTLEDLPSNSAIAQSPTQDLLLRTDDNGPTYLYVKQQQGTLLFVSDVTTPSRFSVSALRICTRDRVIILNI
jgi:hypothetical protein